MQDEMFFSPTSRSLHRGRRVAPRTETCRPCVIWPEDAPDINAKGVIVDINAHGMRIRMLESMAPGMRVLIQLMRDEEFNNPLAKPLRAMIVRNFSAEDGFVDHGVQVVKENLIKEPRKALRTNLRTPRRYRATRTRMYTRDLRGGSR